MSVTNSYSGFDHAYVRLPLSHHARCITQHVIASKCCVTALNSCERCDFVIVCVKCLMIPLQSEYMHHISRITRRVTTKAESVHKTLPKAKVQCVQPFKWQFSPF